ncbi:MAG: MBL fold metallo-hydrolase [Dehalococcoidia bacterium]|nr:MBL fold metallo-hydrolase [Dehalococcoidia bacterium]
MKIKWIGHSCFLITSDKGVKILTDPFHRDTSLSYPRVTGSVDIITVSHEHNDHNDVDAVLGRPAVLKGAAQKTMQDIVIRTVGSYHDENKGKERGSNTIFCFTVNSVNICHLGDLGHQLSSSEIKALGKVDVLLIPIGGSFTLNAAGATLVYEDVKPRVAIPMHYKTDRCQWLKSTADDFIKGKKHVRKLDSNEVEFSSGKLPEESEVLILKYSGQA